VKNTQVGPIEKEHFFLRTSATTSIGVRKPTQHKPPLRINVSTL
jgi:hypothetical protein